MKKGLTLVLNIVIGVVLALVIAKILLWSIFLFVKLIVLACFLFGVYAVWMALTRVTED